MRQIYAEQYAVLPLGKWQEHQARQIIFDISEWTALYGTGRAELLYQRPDDERPYIMTIEQQGQQVIWLITNYHTHQCGRDGWCELRYYAEDTLVKSKTWKTRVESALPLPSDEEITEPEKSWLEQLLQGNITISGSTSSVPSYVTEEAHRVAKAVQKLQNEHTFSFLALSDMHYQAEGEYAAQSRTSLLHASQAAEIIGGLVHLDFVAMLGDVGWGYAESIDGALEEKNEANNLMWPALRGYQNFRAEGNHDKNTSAVTLTSAQVYNTIGRFNGDVERGETPVRNYCLKDLPQHKLRVIVVNTSDPNGLDGKGDGVSDEQLLWFAGALDLSGKEDAAAWSILLLSHEPLDFEPFGGDVAATYTKPEIQKILEAYAAGSSIAVCGKAFSYKGKNVAPVIGNIHGHLHNYAVGNLGDSVLMRISAPNVVFYRNNEYGDAYPYPNEDFRARWGDGGIKYEKTADSAEDTAFCIFTVDTAAKKIYATHYGAGIDREVDYTALAAAYTNLFDPEDPDFSVGRLNSSGAVNPNYTEGFVSGFMPCVYGDVVRARGTTPFGTSYGVMSFYDADKKYLNYQAYVNGESVEVSEDGMSICFGTSYLSPENYGAIAYCRVMGYGAPEDFIVTINEEIES